MNEKACALADRALLALFKRVSQEADAVVERADSFMDGEGELVKSPNGSDSNTYYVLHVLIDSQRRIAEHAKDIAEAVLDMTLSTLRKQELPDLRSFMPLKAKAVQPIYPDAGAGSST